MGTEVAKQPAGLASLASGLQRVKKTAPAMGGKRYLSFGRDGEWSLGKNGDVMNGERVLFNVMTYRTGCSLVQAKPFKVHDEVLLLATAGVVDINDLEPAPKGSEWKFTRSIEGRAMAGDKAEFVFNTSSYGGNKAMEPIMDEVLARASEGSIYVCPIIELGDNWDDHDDWGKTYEPILDVVGWADMEGNPEGQEALPAPDEGKEEQTEAKTEEAPGDAGEEADEPPARRRRR